MRRHTKTYTMYTVNELDAVTKQKVIDKYRDIEVEFGGWDNFVIEDFTKEMEEMGFNDVRVFYSGFWSQGDGASFECSVDVITWLDCHKVLKKKYKRIYNDLVKTSGGWRFEIGTSGNYSHEMTMYTSVEYYTEDEELSKQFEAVEDLILEGAREEARGLYRKLEHAYEDLTSDDMVEECLNANNYQFLKDGSNCLYI